ncbi:hypothetical protein FB451DRAFT_1391167 [Mycena latifolia]|nr:hypothetical protein FB451DRAFT_1391167 [Mycena latifolia]
MLMHCVVLALLVSRLHVAMPAIHHAHRDRNPPSPPGLALPSLAALLSRSSGTSTSTDASTDPDASISSTYGTANVNAKKSQGTPGFRTDRAPLFLRRSKASRVADDVVQRGLDATRLLGSIAGSVNSGRPWRACRSWRVARRCFFDTVQVRLCFSSSLLLERRLPVPSPPKAESPAKPPSLRSRAFAPHPLPPVAAPASSVAAPRLPTLPVLHAIRLLLHAIRLLLPAIRSSFSGSPRLPPGVRLPASRY